MVFTRMHDFDRMTCTRPYKPRSTNSSSKWSIGMYSRVLGIATHASCFVISLATVLTCGVHLFGPYYSGEMWLNQTSPCKLSNTSDEARGLHQGQPSSQQYREGAVRPLSENGTTNFITQSHFAKFYISIFGDCWTIHNLKEINTLDACHTILKGFSKKFKHHIVGDHNNAYASVIILWYLSSLQALLCFTLACLSLSELVNLARSVGPPAWIIERAMLSIHLACGLLPALIRSFVNLFWGCRQMEVALLAILKSQYHQFPLLPTLTLANDLPLAPGNRTTLRAMFDVGDVETITAEVFQADIPESSCPHALVVQMLSTLFYDGICISIVLLNTFILLFGVCIKLGITEDEVPPECDALMLAVQTREREKAIQGEIAARQWIKALLGAAYIESPPPDEPSTQPKKKGTSRSLSVIEGNSRRKRPAKRGRRSLVAFKSAEREQCVFINPMTGDGLCQTSGLQSTSSIKEDDDEVGSFVTAGSFDPGSSRPSLSSKKEDSFHSCEDSSASNQYLSAISIHHSRKNSRDTPTKMTQPRLPPEPNKSPSKRLGRSKSVLWQNFFGSSKHELMGKDRFYLAGAKSKKFSVPTLLVTDMCGDSENAEIFVPPAECFRVKLSSQDKAEQMGSKC